MQQEATGELKVGEVLDDKFQVVDTIGEGGMGKVFKVRHWDWNLDLAVKAPHARLVDNPDARRRWILEAHTWVGLGMHPSIVRCWFVRDWHGLPLLFLDFLPGGSLRDLMFAGEFHKPDPWKRILDLLIQACDGLAHAHHHGLIHRDVKPANLLLTAEGNLCVTDFGLVKLNSEEPEEGVDMIAATMAHMDLGRSLTATGMVMGTPAYAAPEQWLGKEVLGPYTDIYSLGVVMYEIVCGRRPFDAEGEQHSLSRIVTKHVMEAPPDPRTLRPDLPEPFAQLILYCLNKKSVHRPQSMEDLRGLLVDVYYEITGEVYPKPPARAGDERADALNNKAVSLWHLGMSQEAFDAWREASKLDALHPESVYNRSVLQFRLGQVDADEVLRRLRQVKSTHRRAGAFLGGFQLERFDPRAAESELEEALELPEVAGEAPVWRSLGDARMSLQKFPLAVEAYHRASQLSPDDPATRLRLDMASRRSRHNKEGELCFPLANPVQVLEQPATALAFAEGQLLVAGPTGIASVDRSTGASRWSRKESSERPYSALAVCGDLVLGLNAPPGRAWKLENGEVAFTLPDQDRLFAARENVAVGGLIDLGVYQLPGGERLRALRGHMNQVNSVAISLDGARAISGGCDRTVRYWDLATGKCIHVLTAHRDYVDGVALSPDGTLGLSVSRDRTLKIWHLASGDCLASLGDLPAELRHVEMTADGKVVVAWGTGVVSAWDLSTRSRLFSRPGPACLVPGSGFLLAGSPPSVWELPSGRCMRTLGDAAGTVRALVASPAARWAAWGDDARTCVWELDEGSRLYDHTLLVVRTRSHGEGEEARQEFVTHLDNAQRLLDSDQPEAAYQELNAARTVPGYDRDPAALALAARLATRLVRSGIRSVWEIRSFTESASGGIADLALSDDGKRALSAAGKLVRLWDLNTGSCIRGFTGHTERVTAVGLSPDGLVVYSAGQDGTVRQFSAATGDSLGPIARAGEGLVAMSVGPRITVLSQSGRLTAWMDGDCRLTLECGENVRCMVANDRLALCGGDAGVGLWDLIGGSLAHRWDCGSISGLAITPDGRFGLVSTHRGKLLIYNLAEPKGRPRELSWGPVTSLRVSPDGRRAAGIESGGTAELLELERGTRLSTVSGPLVGLEVTADERFLLTAGREGTIRLWEVDWELGVVSPNGAAAPHRPGFFRRLLSRVGLKGRT